MDLNFLLLSVIFCCISAESQNINGTSKRRRETYDIIIVGGGTAGSVLARRLSEISSWKILLVEAGGCQKILQRDPATTARYQGSNFDWHYEIAPQNNSCLGLKEEKLFWAAGKALGGTSEINYMIYSRGNKKDYNSWARKGNPGWSYNQVLPYFLKSEHYRFTTFSTKYHSKAGLMSIEQPYTSNVSEVFLEAAKELGYNIQDYNGRIQTRFSKIRAHLNNGQKQSVYRAFLETIRHKRENLVIICSAYVTRVIIDNNGMAKGVMYVKNGKTKKAFATKEIILSAGVVGSVKILLLSGIGPKEDLEELQIHLVQNLPVGRGIQDHISYFGLNYLTNLETNLNYFSNVTGISSSPAGMEAIGFIKINNTDKKPNTPDFEILLANHLINKNLKSLTNMRDDIYEKYFQTAENFIGMNIFPILLHPESKGFIKLRSKNPMEMPVIQPNYLSAKEDIKKMITAIRFIEKMMKTEKIVNVDASLYPVPVCDEFEINSDEYWECAVKTLTMSFNDYMGGCKMGPSTDEEAVVDSKLQVHGEKNLMVVDASIIPVTISGHVGAATVMIAEKAADIIKQKRIDEIKNR